MSSFTPSTELLDALATFEQLEVTPNAPLAPLTTWKLGGPAALLIDVKRASVLPNLLALLARERIPWWPLGNGSNVLISDEGLNGVVLTFSDELSEISLERDAFGPGKHLVHAGAGASLTKLLRIAKEENLSDLWVLGGIPGTIGGAVRMNAGTKWGEVRDSLFEVELASQHGLAPMPAESLDLSYRHANIPTGHLITRATFFVSDADVAMRASLENVLEHRKNTQPLQAASCGSVFANPEGDSAGRLIEAAGLKGARMGAMVVSEQHANWILNEGEGRANDAYALIRYIQREVQEQFGVRLRPEVRTLGKFSAENGT